MLTRYFGQGPDTDLWHRYDAMKCASLLREAMWSMVSEITSDLNFDYFDYTRTNLDRYRQGSGRPEFLKRHRHARFSKFRPGRHCRRRHHRMFDRLSSGKARVGCCRSGTEKITSGTTFHAAGLVGQLRSNANVTQLLGYSVSLYETLEQETGQATGWKRNGGLRLACTPERWTEVKRQATTAHSFGLDMQLLSPQEALDLWPIMDIEDVIGAAFLPTDGQANPSDITLSLAKGARMAGARIFEDTQVLSVSVDKGVIKGVETARGFIACGTVIACCGQWTRDFANRSVSMCPSSQSSINT